MNITTKKKKYLQICRILDEIERRGNFCNIRTENGIVTCNSEIKHYGTYMANRNGLCCENCANLTKKGCRAKSIACKMAYCFIGFGPKSCGLIITKEQATIAKRRYKLILLIKRYIKKHGIPMTEQRASMSAQFKMQKMANEKSIINYDELKARFINK